MLRRLSEGQRRTIAHWGMEFVVVLIGVLFALWLQEEATQVNKRRDAEAAEAAIRQEVGENLMILVAHEVVADCRGARLTAIERRLETSELAAPIATHWGITSFRTRHPAVYGFFELDISDTAWRSAIANGSVSAMKAERFRSIASIYAIFDKIQKAIELDRQAAKTLQVLSYATPLTPELRGSLISALATAQSNRSYLTGPISTRAFADEMRALGWNDRQRFDELIRDFKEGMKGYGVELDACAKPFANPFAQNTR